MRRRLFQHHRHADGAASADAADAQIRPPDPVARLRLPDQNPHSHQARLQKLEIRHRDVGAEQRRRRLLGEPGLQLVQRSLETPFLIADPEGYDATDIVDLVVRKTEALEKQRIEDVVPAGELLSPTLFAVASAGLASLISGVRSASDAALTDGSTLMVMVLVSSPLARLLFNICWLLVAHRRPP